MAPRQLSAYEQQRVDILARAGLKLAGFKPADLRKAHKRDVEALDAVRIRRSHDRDGNEVRAVEEPDHNVRLVAARAIKSMVPGMYPSQAPSMERQEAQGLQVQIILLQSDGQQQVVDVTTLHPIPAQSSSRDV